MAEKLWSRLPRKAPRWRSGGLALANCQAFTNDAGARRFQEYLAALPDVPARVMVGAVGEDYRFETLPRLWDGPQMARAS
jgi:hypothetical protein